MLDAINTNTISLSTQNNLTNSQNALATSIQRLSSGLKINTAADDPAGLAIASRMQSQVNGLNQATQNAQNGVSMLQTADGGLASTTALLQSMRTLAVEAANGTNSSTDLASLQTEITQLQAQIGDVANNTQYNGTALLDGTATNTQFQVGSNAGQVINVGIQSAAAGALGSNQLNTNAGVTSPVAAATAGALGTGATAISNGISAQTMTITGNSPTATIVQTTAGESAQAIATQINTSTTGGANPTGVSASASTSATLQFAATGVQSITIGGGLDASGNPVAAQAVSASYVAGSSGAYTDMANAINKYSTTTGVTATVLANNGGLTLSNTTGADINVSNQSTTLAASVTSNGTTVTLAANGTPGSDTNGTTVAGSIQLSSASGFAINAAGSTGTDFFSLGSSGSTLQTVATIDVTAVTNGIPTGANQALKIIDGAIQQINTNRAQIGAYENRFTATVANLQTSTLNITTALSTVEDTNFASETANLSRAQILQQAGTAMLAQANSAPNGVLALLR